MNSNNFVHVQVQVGVRQNWVLSSSQSWCKGGIGLRIKDNLSNQSNQIQYYFSALLLKNIVVVQD